MTQHQVAETLQTEMRQELTERILPFWMRNAVDRHLGGFVGHLSDRNVPATNSPKGAVLNARILWTFAAAFRAIGDPALVEMAERADDYIGRYFFDPVHGGVFWMVDAAGSPLDERKHVYAQAFAVYGLSEFHRATGDAESLRRAVEIFELIERRAHDPLNGGYIEAFDRAWKPLGDVRLSAEDADEPKSMNTHLHLLEAYANLLRMWPDDRLAERTRALIEIFLDRVIDRSSGHARLFFAADWVPGLNATSYGHDIETSWLLMDASDVIGDDGLRARVRDVSLALAEAVLAEAFDPAGGIFYEARPGGIVDTDKEWWPQAEAIVGFLNAYQETRRPDYLSAAWHTWAFIRRHIVDEEFGEWHWRVTRDGAVLPGHEKVGPWKCPYHNSRACLEVIARVDALSAARRTGQP